MPLSTHKFLFHTLYCTIKLNILALGRQSSLFPSLFFILKKKKWTGDLVISGDRQQPSRKGDKSSIFFYVYRLFRQLIIREEEEENEYQLTERSKFKLRRTVQSLKKEKGVVRSCDQQEQKTKGGNNLDYKYETVHTKLAEYWHELVVQAALSISRWDEDDKRQQRIDRRMNLCLKSLIWLRSLSFFLTVSTKYPAVLCDNRVDWDEATWAQQTSATTALHVAGDKLCNCNYNYGLTPCNIGPNTTLPYRLLPSSILAWWRDVSTHSTSRHARQLIVVRQGNGKTRVLFFLTRATPTQGTALSLLSTSWTQQTRRRRRQQH